jgi:hypothetical protein
MSCSETPDKTVPNTYVYQMAEKQTPGSSTLSRLDSYLGLITAGPSCQTGTSAIHAAAVLTLPCQPSMRDKDLLCAAEGACIHLTQHVTLTCACWFWLCRSTGAQHSANCTAVQPPEYAATSAMLCTHHDHAALCALRTRSSTDESMHTSCSFGHMVNHLRDTPSATMSRWLQRLQILQCSGR